jgi:hypothetical protein
MALNPAPANLSTASSMAASSSSEFQNQKAFGLNSAEREFQSFAKLARERILRLLTSK